ncbi:MAG: acetylxylan esterase [Gemmataceae bacterium]|nr:acetylxylan esterase [Gemmataceae bacterium]
MISVMNRTSLIPWLAAAALPAVAADPPKAENAYLAFVKKQAADLRAKDAPPASAEAWAKRRGELRGQLVAAWGGFPAEKCPLDPQHHGELKRDGYRVEKITFQTRPGVRMTANAYVPDKPGRLPAILMVHGHWRGAKQDPVVQSRCIGAARLGFFVLCVDAFGAGERGVGTALGEYHGEMTAATLLPVGLPLSGLQVYENMRAVDYLLTRSEVDGERIGITGASGGGNQTMYAGAMDDRLKAVVPVCSVGNYQAYLGAACCLCEVVPGALKFTEEGDVLGLVAPRALMVVSATRDAFQFSVGEAKKSVAAATPIFKLLGKPESIRHAVFDSPHDYNRDMREAMYGWMTLHLKGEGDGSPVREPEIKTEDPEALRCFPGDTRPKDFVTVPKFAAAEGRKLLAARKRVRPHKEKALERGLGGLPGGNGTAAYGTGAAFTFDSEPGVTLPVRRESGPDALNPLVLLLNLDGGKAAEAGPLADAFRKAGVDLVTVDLRATGTLAVSGDKIGNAPDHNSAEWGLWVGRPLLGQWVQDVRRVIDAARMTLLVGGAPQEVIVVGEGPAGLVALAAAATDKRITKTAAVGALASFVTDEPYKDQRLGVMAPGILRDVGDVAHLAVLAAPRRVVIAGGVGGNGKPLTAEQLREAYQPASQMWAALGKPAGIVIETSTDPPYGVGRLTTRLSATAPRSSPPDR